MTGDPIREMRLDVRPGLYALRYVSSADVRTAPFASVRPAAASAATVEVVSVPGSTQGELSGPGSSVVIVASAPGAVEIRLTAFQGAQNLDARFSLDLLASAEPQRSLPSKTLFVPSAPDDGQPRQIVASLDVVAHVSRRGDVRADEEGWIAGPRAPSSIEAVQVQVRGADVGVAAQFRNMESRTPWSAWLTPGAMIGVPRKACALTGVRLKLVGPMADRYDMAGEALFLGAPKISAKGGEIEFVAPGELDPLIGLKLHLVERAIATPTVTAPAALQDKTPRVRVFR